jgi:uncharacterized protein YraI
MKSKFTVVPLLLVTVVLLGGCSFLGLGGGSTEESSTTAGEPEVRAVVPTFTATPPGAPVAPTATIAFDQSVGGDAAAAVIAPAAVVTGTAPLTATAPVTAAVPAAEPTASPTPAAKPRLVVQQAGINVRTGPGVNFGVGGTATTGDEFDIIAKNQAGDWWQICCVNGEPVWIFGELATVTNAESVVVNESIAAQPTPAPVAAAPAPVAPAPAPAPAQPEPTPAPAAPPANDPCAGIGGDGCKFKLRGGPAFAANGELKLTLGFIHSGIDGGQPQGSYFVVVLKDGQNLGVSDAVRSFDPSVEQRSGPNGKYNYEYKISLDRLGGSVAGNYTLWVLDGNGERDSQDVNFSVPDGQGEVWMVFDQA